MTNISCGIDFGTTNSAISICDQEVKLIEVEDSKLTIPTAIFYPSDKITTPIYGRRALNNYIAGESGRFMRSLKRILGTDLMDNATSINGKSMMFTDIISDFIKHIKTNSEKQLNKNIENVVIGRPIHFSDGNIKNDNKAVAVMTKIANQVGFKNVDFQYEPIAAAFAHEQSIKDEKLAFVIDIGGGTSDFTVIKIGAKLKDKIDRTDDIISNHGICLGGNDLDKDLSINSFMPELGLGSFHTNKLGRTLPVPKQYYFGISEWSKINTMYNLKNIRDIRNIQNQSYEFEKLEKLIEIYEDESAHKLLNIVEDTKISLTDMDIVEKQIDFLSNKPKFTIKKDCFENSIQENIERIEKVALETINKAQITKENIDLIILTGGSTEIPYIQNRFIKLFPNAIISNNEKLSSVGLGLGFDAKRKFL